MDEGEDLGAELGVEEAAEGGGGGGGERLQEEGADAKDEFEDPGAEFGAQQVLAAGEGAGEGGEEFLLGHTFSRLRNTEG